MNKLGVFTAALVLAGAASAAVWSKSRDCGCDDMCCPEAAVAVEMSDVGVIHTSVTTSTPASSFGSACESKQQKCGRQAPEASVTVTEAE